jgi:signal transduction histidine kinase
VAVSLSQKGVDLRVDLDPSDPMIVGDPQRIEQVLDNLLSNAAKFTEEGSVTVRTSTDDGGRASIEITDTGVGISRDYLDRLFMPFVQEDSRLNRRFEGSGLGLPLVKRLLDLMHGEIEIESEKGGGSKFRISLPMTKSRKREANWSRMGD